MGKIFAITQKTISELIRKRDFVTLRTFSELGIQSDGFRLVLLQELSRTPITANKFKLIEELIEHSHRETLEEMARVVFSKPEIINHLLNPDMGKIKKITSAVQNEIGLIRPDLLEGDIVKTKKGTTLIIMKFIDKGKR